MKMPPAEVEITETLVQQLLQSQCPELAALPLRFLDEGWDNVMYRLGDDCVVRLPRREVGATLLARELKWLPIIGKKLPINIPTPIKAGVPEGSFPWPWGVVPWFEGQTANLSLPQAEEALRLTAFLKKLHQPAPENVPKNPARNVPLLAKAELVEKCWQQMSEKEFVVPETIKNIWETALTFVPPTEKCWIHGDLHSRNIIVHDEKLAAIIDWGDMTGGDPATDLASLWMLFDDEVVRAAALQNYGASPQLIQRTKGWAVFMGSILLATGLGEHEQHAEMGRRVFDALIS